MTNKPYKIEFTSVPSYNNDNAEWWKFEVIEKSSGETLNGSSRAGTQEEIEEYIHEMMEKRLNSITCHDKKPARRAPFKKGQGINLPDRRRVKYG